MLLRGAAIPAYSLYNSSYPRRYLPILASGKLVLARLDQRLIHSQLRFVRFDYEAIDVPVSANALSLQ